MSFDATIAGLLVFVASVGLVAFGFGALVAWIWTRRR